MQQNWLNWKPASQWPTHSRQTLGNAWKRSCPLTTSANVWRRSLIPRQTSRLIIIILSLSLILRNSTFRNPPQSQRNSTFRNATQKRTMTKLWAWRRLANKQWVRASKLRWSYWWWIVENDDDELTKTLESYEVALVKHLLNPGKSSRGNWLLQGEDKVWWR